MNNLSSGFIQLCWIGLIFLTSCGEKKENVSQESSPVVEYAVMAITPQSVALSNDYPATIEGVQNIEIRPKIDGYIDKIFVDEGATVKKGQSLFKIFAPQYEQEVRTAKANISIAEANVNAAQMEVNKVKPLVEKNIISKYELQSAEFNLESRKAALAQANATLANAQTNLGYTVVTSPVNGVMGTIPYRMGSLVSSNTVEPLTTVSNNSEVYAYFSINEKQVLEFTRHNQGATIQERLKNLPPVTLVLANGSELPDKGKVETASGIVNTATGSLKVRATFPNKNNLVASGSSGSVRIPVYLDSALLVPQKSTYEIQGKTFVYKVKEDETVGSVEIVTRANSGGQFFVAEEGLKAGDRIVIEGVTGLREGLLIKPRLVAADSLFQVERTIK